MNHRPTRAPRARALALSAGFLTALAGCSNPFAFYDSDYGKRVPVERLRNIDPMEMDRFKKAQAPPTDEDLSRMMRERFDRNRFDGLAKAELKLEECRASALENNLDLKVAIIDPTIAAQSVSEEEGRFETAFTTRALWQETDSPTASSLASAQSKVQSIEPGVTIPLRTGETINVSLPVARSETSNQFSTLNPAYTSDLAFSISQPLLRGGGRRANTAALRVAAYNRQVSEAQTKLETIRQLAAVDRAYWRLYQARRSLEVTQQQYELADAQLQRSQRRVNSGQSAEIEVIRAQSGLGQRLEAIIRAENIVLLQQRELKRIMNMPGLPVDSQTVIVPGTEPDPVEYEVDRKAAADLAVTNRMEMLALELQVAADATRIDFERNAALPLLTMDYTYRVNGLGNTRDRAFHQLAGNDFEDWSIGLNASVPIGNESGLSRVRRAILQRLQRLGSKSAREQSIRQEVLGAIDDINLGWQRILAARQSTILSTRTFAAEQRQFDVGARTSTDVLNAAALLAEAQLTEISALTDYQIAQVDLAFASGMLLGAGKVRWEPAPEPDDDLEFKRDYLRVGPSEEEQTIIPGAADPGQLPVARPPAPEQPR